MIPYDGLSKPRSPPRSCCVPRGCSSAVPRQGTGGLARAENPPKVSARSLVWPREDIPQERTALVRAHAQATVQEPHEVHAFAILWQTMIYGLELLVAHHVSYITKRLVEKFKVAEIDILQNENQWPLAFNVITSALECAAARAEHVLSISHGGLLARVC